MLFLGSLATEDKIDDTAQGKDNTKLIDRNDNLVQPAWSSGSLDKMLLSVET